MNAFSIEVQDLVKTYPKGIRALNELTFAVPQGILFGLLGPNGAGKSTTVKILTTLSRADSGIARIVGLDVRRNPEQVRRVIGVVGQKASADPEATGRENIALQGKVFGLSGRVLADRVTEMLERLDLVAAAGRTVRTYSGGMKRRLDIAMGLVHRPQVLFLDEPTTGLDPEIRAQIWDYLSRLVREDGITILLTTHYLEEADQLAGLLAIVDRGRVVATGTPSELKERMRADTLHVKMGALPLNGEIDRALTGLPDISEYSVTGDRLKLRIENGAVAITSVLASLEGHGVEVASATVSRPSLDDVYLRYTGRLFDADSEVSQ
ncbi:ATP-binding cassette domain-containing protein [Streptomyces sp. NPDC059679]|uniref:ATP-binding cassette domain-containing protein n=1 Tax=Streptomyces sp. NPDC059679 TaxID=3346903 RepID=UPI00369420FD